MSLLHRALQEKGQRDAAAQAEIGRAQELIRQNTALLYGLLGPVFDIVGDLQQHGLRSPSGGILHLQRGVYPVADPYLAIGSVGFTWRPDSPAPRPVRPQYSCYSHYVEFRVVCHRDPATPPLYCFEYECGETVGHQWVPLNLGLQYSPAWGSRVVPGRGLQLVDQTDPVVTEIALGIAKFFLDAADPKTLPVE